jgi:uncharacterized protein (DUF1778 family)
MSKSLSLTVSDDLIREADEAANELHMHRDSFVLEAIRRYARHISRRRVRRQLKKESAATAQESLKVLHEFEAIG